MTILLSRYYQIVTEESAAEGDIADSGEVYTDREVSIREAIAEIRNGGFSEPSSSWIHCGMWLSTSDDDIDYRTGEDRSESLHFRRSDNSELSIHQLARLLKAARVKVR